MTELLYQKDSYLQECQAKVVALREDAVVLDRTPFYPGGGGQPADVGKILWSGYVARVEKVKKAGDDVLHHISGPRPEMGQLLRCKLDWDRRYALMRTHTALHIMCGVIWREYKAQVTGGNMEPLKGRLDFELESMSKDFAEKMEEMMNAEVTAARPIEIRILPREDAFQIPDLIRTKINLLPAGITQVRTVGIKGLDLQADGGTHVANTEEVGKIKVAGHESKGKINKRLRIELEA